MVCAEWRRSRAAAVAGLQLHNNRERQHSNTNPDIDRSRSELNYSLIEQNTHNYNKLIDERLQQGYKGKKAIRKDAVKMCEMLFTSDGDFFSRLSEQEQRQFFIDCFEFAANRYGRENIIAATVHLDEATPHLHLDFVPLTPDGRLSVKDILGGRKEMQQLQDDFYSVVSIKYGLERGSRADLESGETSRKHLETAEYKEMLARNRTKQAEQAEQIAQTRIQAANQAAAEAEQIAADQQRKAEKLEQRKKDLQEEIDRQEADLQAEKEKYKQQIEELEKNIAQAESRLQALQGRILTTEEVNRINGKKTLTGALRGVSWDEFSSLKATAARSDQAEDIIRRSDEIKAEAQAEAEKIISDAKEKAAKELEQFHTYKRWTKDALNEYSEQKKKNDEITQQTDKSKERLSEVQNQITSAEQERDRIRQETESLNRTMEQLTQNQDDRYCSFQIELSVFGKLMETAQEYHVAVRTERICDGKTVIVKTSISEKKYLALSIEKARKLVPPPHAQPIPTAQPPRRRGSHL